MHNSIQIIGNLGRDPERRQTRANGTPFTVLSVATRRSWKDAGGEWQSRTDWHRVVCFNRGNDSAVALHRGDHVLVVGSLRSIQYQRETAKDKAPTTLKLTSWHIRASVVRKLNRAANQPEAVTSGISSDSNSAPF
jgi:single-strand DNA-binding protein